MITKLANDVNEEINSPGVTKHLKADIAGEIQLDKPRCREENHPACQRGQHYSTWNIFFRVSSFV